jgi:hypothetical protein
MRLRWKGQVPEESHEVVDSLHDLGVKVAMITGDAHQVAAMSRRNCSAVYAAVGTSTSSPCPWVTTIPVATRVPDSDVARQ